MTKYDGISRVFERLEVSLPSPQRPSSFNMGRNDPVFPVDQVQYINHIIEHAPQHTHIIPGGAHYHPVERPWGIADITGNVDIHVIDIDTSNINIRTTPINR